MDNVQKHNNYVNIEMSQILDIICSYVSPGPRNWYCMLIRKRIFLPLESSVYKITRVVMKSEVSQSAGPRPPSLSWRDTDPASMCL
jgi:hypothetical protein